MQIVDWTIDYGDGNGEHPVRVPHAWRQEADVRWEGPALYRTQLKVDEPGWLLFHGVSYRAVVRVNGETKADHSGIWDAFSVRVPEGDLDIEVEVIKNGGAKFPVRDVASGFLPFVYQTFGGLYGEVDFVPGAGDPAEPGLPARQRISVKGSKIYADGQPFYVRGVLHWGWYPELGHPNAPEATVREESRLAKRLGFNLVKFCLWIPPHRYLEALRDEGMLAWIELPLWDPSPEPGKQAQMAAELKRIVLQYRHHDNILCWTAGCELGRNAPPVFREGLYQMVRELTGCPLVKDNSGGSEMYSADPREFGDFYDFHPYCDTPFFPPVLDSLAPGARRIQPVLLGEFNDADVHRDLSRLKEETPYWASAYARLNAQGVRWQFDLPRILADSRLADPNASPSLRASSETQTRFMRKFVQEAVRARDFISGYVITGWRDTPVSSSGLLDDYGKPRVRAEDTKPWNGDACLFLIPQRRPPWVAGGNRPGWRSPFSFFCGEGFWRVGAHSISSASGRLNWEVLQTDERGCDARVCASGSGEMVDIPALEAREVCQISFDARLPGGYLLRAEFNGARNEWPVGIFERPDFRKFESWGKYDPLGLFEDIELSKGRRTLCSDVPQAADPADGVWILQGQGTSPSPFWREAAYEFIDDEFWREIRPLRKWEHLLSISSDRVLDSDFVKHLGDLGQVEVLLNRVDVRTYRENAVLLRLRRNAAVIFVTTLRPYGGLGIMPYGVTSNPAGAYFLAALMSGFDSS